MHLYWLFFLEILDVSNSSSLYLTFSITTMIGLAALCNSFFVLYSALADCKMS